MAFSSEEELTMALTYVKDDLFRVYIKGVAAGVGTNTPKWTPDRVSQINLSRILGSPTFLQGEGTRRLCCQTSHLLLIEAHWMMAERIWGAVWGF